ncbi:MAG: hypothetical protein GX895_01680 [Clostridiales bacterium]|uniref:hypothetical protein n=1 Tax=Clostridium sp. N3C TaxID=1776758 RepID=UPI00092DF189|nr:hypothetical protein [Clostridium sp. N3C]NLZ47491.1 hypothetical protein [Clostridiales bacterium]SCN21644.1 hypothetical protein N3C_0343 [Clostridium sp. N3C]
MKKILFVTITIVLLGFSYFLVKMYNDSSNILTEPDEVKYDILTAGVKEAKDFTTDNKNIYIAFKDRIQVIERNGKSYALCKFDNGDIRSLQFYDNKLYIINGPILISFDIVNHKREVLMEDIPNFGDYGECKLMLKEDKIYIAIGAATNSGVVGLDNKWKSKYPFNYDISPKDITITDKVNKNYGAFIPFNTKNTPGQKISGHFPGNASVIVYNPKNKESFLYCWGVRNVKAMDYDSIGKIFAVVGGMEPRGFRAVQGDVDYIYELKSDTWYGWPDYSGGDPITSPRFKSASGDKLSFILQKHPSTNPPAPYYQHKSVNSLTAMTIDRKGTFGKKDSMFFYDNSNKILFSIDNKGIVEEKLKLGKNSEIIHLEMYNGNMLLLEKNQGLLIKLTPNNEAIKVSYKVVLIYVILFIFILIVIVLWKWKFIGSKKGIINMI